MLLYESFMKNNSNLNYASFCCVRNVQGRRQLAGIVREGINWLPQGV